jgi:cytidylate kinase
MHRVITISREYGGGGESVGRLLADRLGWRLLDRDLLNEVARAANVEPAVAERYDECIDSWLHRLAKQSLRHGSPDRPTHLGATDLFDAETMVAVGRGIIEEAARFGHCVIVGRGAQCILHGRAGVFNAFLYAPMQMRIRRIEELLGPRPDLETVIRESDRSRAAYIRKYFDRDWRNPFLYDLMVNTRHGYEAAAEAVLGAAGLKDTTASAEE